MPRILALILSALALTLAGTAARADGKTELRLDESRRVFESFSNLDEQAIPDWLLERAYGVIVIPDVIRGALLIGGRGGKGVMSVRNPDGSWSNPVFVRLAGASIGFQWGVQSTDLVLVLMSRKSVEGIAGGKVTLGADASIAAGPIGRSAAAATDASFKAQVLAYARNEGLFAGVALDGSVISIDDAANMSSYAMPDILASQILEGTAGTPSAGAIAFREMLTKATSGATSVPGAPTAPGAAPAPATPAAPAPRPAPPPADGAQTFPLEDPAPGAPPPQ
jgi:lipid-binding SYLF domain-containing protein